MNKFEYKVQGVDYEYKYYDSVKCYKIYDIMNQTTVIAEVCLFENKPRKFAEISQKFTAREKTRERNR